MKKKFTFQALCALLVGMSVYGQASVNEEALEQCQEVECAIRPIPLSLIQHRNRSALAPTVKTMEHVEGSRPLFSSDTTSTNSLNWSGYAALTSPDNPKNYSVEKVSGSWIVPTLTATTDNSYSSAWVGIDGFFDNETSVTVEQIGTAHFWVDGSPSYFAWFEMYGPTSTGGMNEITDFPVSPGDEMFAKVEYVGNNTYMLKIYNVTQGIFTKIPHSLTFQPIAARTSAQWIVEAPSDSNDNVLPLADFGTVQFSDCKAVIRHKDGTISNKNWDNSEITMVTSGGTVKSQPSSLSDNGKSFTVTWAHE